MSCLCLSLLSSQLGIAAGFLVPPVLVPNVEDEEKLAYHISIMFFMTAGVASGLFILVIVGKEVGVCTWNQMGLRSADMWWRPVCQEMGWAGHLGTCPTMQLTGSCNTISCCFKPLMNSTCRREVCQSACQIVSFVHCLHNKFQAWINP